MIAIPNMDKPEHCYECLLRQGNCCLLLYEATPPTVPLTRLDHCPLIDIIPCKECKNSHMTYDGKCKYCDLEKDDDDNFIECYFDGDHFCSDGERRSE